MLDEDRNTIEIITEEGETILADVLFTYDNPTTNKSYIVYTDNSKDADGNVQVFASIYDPCKIDQQLIPIETEREWTIIKTILNTLQEEIRSRTEVD